MSGITSNANTNCDTTEMKIAILPILLLAACGTSSAVSTTQPTPAAPPNAADVRFMTNMIHHHQQAVRMARLAPSHGASPMIQTMAERIIVSQQDEIAIMETWLKDRGLAPAHHHDPHMPGMLTDEQLRQLDATHGRDFDRLFLQLMIQHHEGALAMVEQLHASHGGAQDETVFRFSSDVFADQSSEIDRMQKMSAQMEQR